MIKNKTDNHFVFLFIRLLQIGNDFYIILNPIHINGKDVTVVTTSFTIHFLRRKNNDIKDDDTLDEKYIKAAPTRATLRSFFLKVYNRLLPKLPIVIFGSIL
jgi:hypothetical protein